MILGSGIAVQPMASRIDQFWSKLRSAHKSADRFPNSVENGKEKEKKKKSMNIEIFYGI